MQRLTRLAEVRAAPQVDQPRLFVQIATFLAALAARHPLVLVMEDLHWADAPSISLLFHLCRTFTASRILVFGTYRPDEVLTERKGEQHPLADPGRTEAAAWSNLDRLGPADLRRGACFRRRIPGRRAECPGRKLPQPALSPHRRPSTLRGRNTARVAGTGRPGAGRYREMGGRAAYRLD